MRSTASLLVALAMLGCSSQDVGRTEGYSITSNDCSLDGTGAVGGDAFDGSITGDGTSVSGTWTHTTSSGDVFVGTPTRLVCTINGANNADVDGTGTWNGSPGFDFSIRAQDLTREDVRLPGPAETVTIEATRTYSPSRWVDGAADWAEGADVTVPESLPVTVGNAGNQWARLTFVEYGTGEPIRCSYRGGASTANPTRPSDVAAGLSYDLARCERLNERGCWETDPSIVAGTVLEVSQVELHVQHGSSRYPSRHAARTTVSVDLDVIPFHAVEGEPDKYLIRIWAPSGALILETTGDLTAGDLTVALN